MSNDKPPVLSLVNSASKPRKKAAGSGSGAGGGKVTPQQFGEYSIKDGCFYQSKPSRVDGGVTEFPLCDFVCEIKEEVIADDGLTDTSFLRIEGRRKDGIALPLVDVPVKSFYSHQGGHWANDHWGLLPYICPGTAKKDNLRAAIQLYSRIKGDVPRCTIYRFTGWKEISGQWHYLTGSGAITASGLIDSVQVDLGAGHMGKYQLPEPLTEQALRQAITETLALLDICHSKPQIGAALLAAIARAPLGECHPTDFAIWIHGRTGSRKSAISAITQAFFGNFTARSFPANWSDSVNDAETKAHQAKDGIFTVDDFKPSVSPAEAAKLHAAAERLIRNTGNQAGRGRRDATMQAKAAPYNRSLMLVTAEELPRGQSLLGRLLVLEIGSDDVDNSVLTKLQHIAGLGSFAGLMASYLQWLASRIDELKKDLPKMIEHYRNHAIHLGFASSHPRAPEIFANLVAGFDVFTNFLSEPGLLSSEESNLLLSRMEESLKLVFSEQNAYIQEQCEVERFIQLVRACFSSGNAHIACRLNQSPPVLRPHSWGWRNAGAVASSSIDDETPVERSDFDPGFDGAFVGKVKLINDYRAMGDSIGWYCDASTTNPAEVWFQQDAVFKVVQQFAKSQGEPFLLSASSLWRRMLDKGVILKTETELASGKQRSTVKRTVAGRNVRVMIISAELIESG